MTETALSLKDKQILDQKIRTKKKQFIRFILSSNNCLPYCLTITENFQNELKNKIEKIINNNDNNNDNNGEKIKLNRKIKKRKTIKFTELIFGLNETFKLIEQQQSMKKISMIWLDNKLLAINMQNIVKKLCNDNQILCLSLNLSAFKQLFHISSLTIITFKQSIETKESKFYDLFSFIQNELNIVTNDKQKVTEIKNECIEESQKMIEQDEKSIEKSSEFNLSDELMKTQESYEERMKKYLKQFENFSTDSANINQNNNESFIRLINDDNIIDEKNEIFIDYDKINNDYNSIRIKIEWLDQSHEAERKKLKNKFTEQLFELNDYDINQPTKFKSPKQVKGLLNPEESNGDKRKRKLKKRENNKNFKRSMKKIKCEKS